MCGVTNKKWSLNTLNEIKRLRRVREMKLCTLGENKQKITHSWAYFCDISVKLTKI
jgi:hypothetical protein